MSGISTRVDTDYSYLFRKPEVKTELENVPELPATNETFGASKATALEGELSDDFNPNLIEETFDDAPEGGEETREVILPDPVAPEDVNLEGVNFDPVAADAWEPAVEEDPVTQIDPDNGKADKKETVEEVVTEKKKSGRKKKS